MDLVRPPAVAGYFYPSEPARLRQEVEGLLLVEVAEASLAYDLAVKAPLYARHGVLELWVLDLEGKRLHVFRSPSPEGYREVQTLAPGNHLAPAAFPSFSLPVAELLG
ncbi:Uma2 family endonuclease [Thermus tengchongensis]|uniref:Uma2 family endonuclease n=1 Tax=Thermus tengchongensis TaxID=1214928 RepID=UPI0023EF4EDA|nr:Uma2 family endonuclease [Thermus tengchongensis]